MSLYDDFRLDGQAERNLNEWQPDPDAWSGRAKHQETAKRMGALPLAVKGSGWYELISSFDGPSSN